MKFRTMYTPHDRCFSPPGNREEPVYKAVFDSAGNYELEVAGKKDLYAEIQSHALSCDIHYLLERYRNGDPAALDARRGFYGDITQAPKSYADMLNIVIAAQQEFDSLPADIRDKFGNNFAAYLTEYGTKDFAAKLGFLSDAPDMPVEEVSADVS